MSITVSDCLKLPALRQATVVAGHRGLSRIITHVSVLEFADLPMLQNPRLFQVNEIVLTSFASVKDDVDAQCAIIEAFSASGDVAMVLYYVGHILTELHPRILQKADQLDFPLILMPPGRLDLAYHEVINDVMEAVFRDQRKNPHFVNDMLERIAQLPDHMRTIESVIQMLAERLRVSLLLVDAAGKCLSFAIRPVSSSLTPEEVLSFFSCTGTEDALFTKELARGPLTLHRIRLRKPYQTLSLLLADESGCLSPEELTSAAELIPLFASIWNYNLDSQSLDALIPCILDGNSARARSIAELRGLDPDTLDRVLFLQINFEETDLKSRHEKLLASAEDLRCRLSSLGHAPLVSCCGTSLIVLFRGPEDGEEQSELVSLLRQGSPCAILSPIENVLQRLPALFHFYSAAIGDARKIFPLKLDLTMADLRFAAECRALLRQPPYPLPEGRGDSYPNTLFDYVSLIQRWEDGDALIETLAAYCLDGERDAKLTGEILFLHHNTVRYRLGKIRRILGFDPSRMPDALLLYRALALHRLRED